MIQLQTMKIYLKDKQIIAHFHKKASSEFWDDHWDIENFRSYICSCTSDNLFIPMVQKYLPAGSTVLDGGCGRGQLVHALKVNGYRAIGVDFAEKTIQKIKKSVPELDIRLGDIRKLPLETNELDGYLSVGVIEHFWEGYSLILEEMQRTIRKNGFLFISFPYLSPLRKLKICVGGYRERSTYQLETQQNSFYQFVLNWKAVLQDLQQYGFILKEVLPWDGVKGLKDELTWFKPLLQPMYDGKKFGRIRPYFDKLFVPFASHCMLLVMQKTS